MHTPLKRGIEAVLHHGGSASLARRTMRGRTLILAYHNIMPDSESNAGERALHLRRSAFARQLDLLLRRHDVVPLARAVDPPGPAGRPRVAITFDDAYLGAITAGAEELVRRGLPATVFVAPGLLGQHFWWDACAAPEAGVVAEDFRRRMLETRQGRDAWVREAARREGVHLAALPAWTRAATLPELERASRLPGITLAAHSWTHPDLTRLNGDELKKELERPLTWLRKRFSGVLPWLAYPYGHWTPAVARAAVKAGYAAALRVDGGWIPASDVERFCLPRLNVPAGISAHGFGLRLAGLLCR